MQQTCEYETDQDREDREYKEATREFNRIYSALKKKRALYMHGRSSSKSALIEIWEVKNNGERKTICRVRAENDTDCHRIAAQQLKWELDKEEKARASGNVMPV